MLKMLRNNAKLGILAAIVMLSVWFLRVNIDRYLEAPNIEKLREIFVHSQYCVPVCEYRGNIDDPELFTLAGWDYLQGHDPSDINWELQPLTKYIFGVSTYLFGNPAIAQLILGAILLYVVGKHYFLLPVILLLIDNVFLEQLTRPYLDLSQTLLIQIFILALLGLSQAKKNLVITAIILGLIALAKSFSVGILAFIFGIVYLSVFNKKYLASYIQSSLISVFVYLLGYSVFFYHHRNPLDFFTLHIDILRLYKSYVPEYPKGEIFRLIYQGEWLKWYGDHGLIKIPEWTIFWPISITTSVLGILISKIRNNPKVMIHIIWIILYLSFVSLRLVFPRYLLPILPSAYIVFSWICGAILESILEKAENHDRWKKMTRWLVGPVKVKEE